MAIIAPSILSADYMNFERDLTMTKEMGAKWLHVDIMDGIFVPNITFGPGVVKEVTPMGGDLLLRVEFDKAGEKLMMAKTASKFMQTV